MIGAGYVQRMARHNRWQNENLYHRTHHRGQVHCLLTQAGGKPGATDFVAMPA
jgi:hypothetical protein